MNERKVDPEESESVVSKVRNRLESLDRGWKATLIGVVITVLYAVGVG